MYINSETYPRTPRERLHYSLKLLAQEFPGRSVEASHYKAPVFEWDGAGSEKGGSAERIKYDKIIFLPAERDAVAVSVGDKTDYGVGMIFQDEYGALRRDREYSALLLQRIPQDAANSIIDYYVEKVAGMDHSENKFSYAMHKLLKSGTSRFWKLPFFAFDSDFTGEMPGFFVKSNRFDPDRTRLLKTVDSLVSAENISQAITKYAQGKAPVTPFAHFARHDDQMLDESSVESILKYLK